MLYKQVYLRAVNTFIQKKPFYYYLWLLPLVLMPWTLTLFILPFKRIAQKSYWLQILRNRKNTNAITRARAWLVCSFISGVILLSVLSGKSPIYPIPLVAPIILLIVDGLFRGNWPRVQQLNWIFIGLFLLFAAGLLIVIKQNYFPAMNHSFALLTMICLLSIAGLWLARQQSLKIILFISMLGIFTLSVTSYARFSHQLDNKLSTKSISLLMKQYIAQGYSAVAYGTYPGVFSYYAGENLIYTRWWAIMERWLQHHPKVIVVTHAWNWKKYKQHLPGLHVLEYKQIAGNHYVVLVTGSDNGKGVSTASSVTAKQPASKQVTTNTKTVVIETANKKHDGKPPITTTASNNWQPTNALFNPHKPSKPIRKPL